MALINCFLSKEERAKPLSDVKDLEILRKGVIRRSYDSTNYYIRITFKDGSEMVFGESVSLLKVELKYRQCVAIIKGLIIPDILTSNFVTDEVIDETEESDKKYNYLRLINKNIAYNYIYISFIYFYI